MTEPTHRHQELAAGRWSRLSLAEQLGNVGTEVGRMRRWRGRLKEIARARKLLCDAALGGREHGATLEDLDRYFLEFALAARSQR